MTYRMALRALGHTLSREIALSNLQPLRLALNIRPLVIPTHCSGLRSAAHLVD